MTVFNSPFELGIRMVFLLAEFSPRSFDLDFLCYLDYALVYSADLGGPSSLHTPVPLRGGEYLSRKQLLEDGLHQMMAKGLVDVRIDETGISYMAGEHARILVGLVGGEYSRLLVQRSQWLTEYLEVHSHEEIVDYFQTNGLSWGAHLLGLEGSEST